MRGRLAAALVCLALLAAVAAVYRNAGNFAFVFDDQAFLPDNPLVARGLTLPGLRWALTATYTGNWHPLTWLSHMLDVQLFGMDAGRHHVVNLLFHALNTTLLFLVLRRLTGALWPSAFVAALFGVHPLHVESVAWVAERKDLVGAFFWLLGMAAYARYAARPGIARFSLVAALLLLGLMSKAMVVTFPGALLLLDWWPLGRLRPGAGFGARIRSCVLEKLPLLLIAAGGGIVAVLAQRAVGAVGSAAAYPAGLRINNALVSYAVYLGKTLWPTDLAAFYPLTPADRALLPAAGAAALLALATGAALLLRRHRPWVLTGWLWHLVTLLPVIGFIQVGGQARADRYLYLPMIGAGIIAAWSVPQILGELRLTRLFLALAALLALGLAASRQAETWRDSFSLYGRMLEVTPDNWLAHNGYGVELQKRGRLPDAIEHYRAAARLNPLSAEAQHNLAFALDAAGRAGEAIAQYRLFLRLRPGHAAAASRLGRLLVAAGRSGEALESRPQAVRP